MLFSAKALNLLTTSRSSDCDCDCQESWEVCYIPKVAERDAEHETKVGSVFKWNAALQGRREGVARD